MRLSMKSIILTTSLAGILLVSFGCGDLTGSHQLPAGTPDPSSFNTVSGAIGMHDAAMYAFALGLRKYVLESGSLTDEITSPATEHTNVPSSNVLDRRILPEGEAIQTSYSALQQARGLANQAIGALTAYGSETSPALRGELYMVKGYTELMLADLFCSGIPLSTLDFQGDYTYHTGSTTRQIYLQALAKFDTALTLASDSMRITRWASIGRGRVLLALDSLTAAKQAVDMVPTSFSDSIAVPWSKGTVQGNALNAVGTVANREGQNGLVYREGDPRSAVQLGDPTGFGNFPQYYPIKYSAGLTGAGYAPIMVATGVEARLIEAEADLRSGGTQWLTILNDLRTDGTSTPVYTRQCQNGITNPQGQVIQQGSPCPAGIVDVKWGWGTGAYLIPISMRNKTTPTCPAARGTPAGTGVPCSDTTSYIGLPPLTDPGTDSARISMLFRERAYWLFLDGHRQEDLRRLIRQYGRSQDAVYPTGIYQVSGFSQYGTDVTVPIPPAERANPLFHGCLDRDA
jgi:hypothetical protein